MVPCFSGGLFFFVSVRLAADSRRCTHVDTPSQTLQKANNCGKHHTERTTITVRTERSTAACNSSNTSRTSRRCDTANTKQLTRQPNCTDARQNQRPPGRENNAVVWLTGVPNTACNSGTVLRCMDMDGDGRTTMHSRRFATTIAATNACTSPTTQADSGRPRERTADSGESVGKPTEQPTN